MCSFTRIVWLSEGVWGLVCLFKTSFHRQLVWSGDHLFWSLLKLCFPHFKTIWLVLWFYAIFWYNILCWKQKISWPFGNSKRSHWLLQSLWAGKTITLNCYARMFTAALFSKLILWSVAFVVIFNTSATSWLEFLRASYFCFSVIQVIFPTTKIFRSLWGKNNK